jgi:hypothetical protein
MANGNVRVGTMIFFMAYFGNQENAKTLNVCCGDDDIHVEATICAQGFLFVVGLFILFLAPISLVIVHLLHGLKFWPLHAHFFTCSPMW